MIGEELMEGHEVDLSSAQVKVIPKDQLSNSDQQQLLELFRAGFGDEWLGDDVFWNMRMKNCTGVLEICSDEKLAAAVLFDNLRIIQPSVHPDFQGQGLGVKLFQEAARIYPETWVSVGIDAEGMLATITSPELSYLPADDQDKIENLLQSTNGSKNSFQVDVKEVALPEVSKRLAGKGVTKDMFIAYAAKSGSAHGQGYYQILFQNQTPQ